MHNKHPGTGAGKMRIVLMGGPGAGKGTQGRLLQREFGILHVSTGEHFRRMYREGIPKAVRLFDEYWGKGLLCPDQVVIDLVQTILPKPNYILDGFPRTVPQAEFLDTHSR